MSVAKGDKGGAKIEFWKSEEVSVTPAVAVAGRGNKEVPITVEAKVYSTQLDDGVLNEYLMDKMGVVGILKDRPLMRTVLFTDEQAGVSLHGLVVVAEHTSATARTSSISCHKYSPVSRRRLGSSLVVWVGEQMVARSILGSCPQLSPNAR